MNDRTQRAYLEAGTNNAKELHEIKTVLKWASKNVACAAIWDKWCVTVAIGGTEERDFEATTLYEALHKAWEGRDN